MELGSVVADLRWWAVPVAAASMFILGGLWYGWLFAGPWQALVGLGDDQIREGSGRVFGVAALASLVICAVLALFIGAGAGVAVGLSAGLLAGVGWLVPAFVITFTFERRPTRLTLIDGSYHVIAFGLVGAVLGWLA